MDQATHNKIVSFIWGIADDVLRDLFVRGKYRDVILPMCVIRRLDAVLEPTKQAVLETKAKLDKLKITEQQAALCDAAGQSFYNTSKFTLRDLKSRGSQQQLQQDFFGLSGRILVQRSGHPYQFRVSRPCAAPFQGRRARHAHRQVSRPGH
jgi:type I restriction enzyme M protein